MTLPVDSVTALAKGQIIDLGEKGISEHGFIYDSNASISANPQRVQLGSSEQTGNYEAVLTDLKPHTRYYINSFLSNGSETTYGYPVSFLTAMSLPEVKTESIADVTDSTALCNGEIIQDGGAFVYARGICWSTFMHPTLLNNHTVDGDGIGKFAGNIIHLKKDSTYFVRAYASNNAGTTFGNELRFTAGQSQTSPTVTTAVISSISQNTAISGGEVVSDGGSSVTSRGVCWSTNPYPTIADSKTTDGNGTGQYVSSINGLTAGTAYYLRAYATNAIGTSYGEEKTFTTIEAPLIPTVTTVSVTNITTTTAQSGGTVLENGGTTVTARGVCWGTASNPTITSTHSSDGSGMGSFSSSITGLVSGTKYYVKAYATNSVGTAYGNEISFTAGQNITTPTVTTTEVVNITQTTATCGGNVTSDGGATVSTRGVCWSTSQNPTTANSKTTDGSGTGGYLSSLTSLAANTTYYVRAYAINSAGTSYGNQKEFLTLMEISTPSVTTAPVTNVTNATATSGGTVTNDGGANVTARGVCYSTAYNPTIADLHTSNGTGTGSFVSQLTSLLPNTFYRVRAYATNTAGTSYGNQQTFSTLSNPILPTVTTAQAINITITTCTSGGTVSSDGGSAVTVRGVCYSTSPNPTLANFYTTNGSGVGTFVSNLSGLTPNTNYYVRAYATNGVGTSYGNEITFTSLSSTTLPTITTTAISNITQTTATSGGNITSDGGATVTARGVCWSTSSNPTTTNSHTSDGSGIGSFVSNLTGLTENTFYYVRAYATNSVGTAYGNEITFTTLNSTSPCPGIPTVTYEGKTYNTIQIGTQCWFKENLNVGTRINGSQSQSNNSIKEKYCYNDLESNCDIYGGLYQWNEAMQYSTTEGIQGLCPSDWHIPTDDEWTLLITYLGGTSAAGGKMKEVGTTHWASPNFGATNESGFTTFGSGYRNSSGNFYETLLQAKIWSSTQSQVDAAWSRNLGSASADIARNNSYKINGFTVRCIQGTLSPVLPAVSTTTVSNITQTTATSGGNVSSDGGASVTVRGVCWSTSTNPTITNSHTSDGSGTGSFVSSLTGLSSNTLYYVRAYATNSVGTAYGDQVNFTTLASTFTCGDLVAYEGKNYSTAQIGSQCWFKENLNVGARINGSLDQTNNSVIEKFCYDDQESKCDIYGGLYQWNEMMQYITTEGAQGICPTGWHLPSDVEYNTLTTYLGGATVAGGPMKEAGTIHWAPPNTGATNSSSFTALPGGMRDATTKNFMRLTQYGNFYTSSIYSAPNVWFKSLGYNYQSVENGGDNPMYGFSVRCILN